MRIPPLANTSPVWNRAWIAVAHSDEVADNAPVQVLVAGEAWVVTRMDGVLTAFEDRCPHRQSPLSAGSVTRAGDGSPRLTCAVHGWRFDAGGQCDLMPGPGGHAHGGHRHHGWPGRLGGHDWARERGKPGRRPEDVTLRPAYGVAERYGLVWLAVEEPITAVPRFPEWAEEGMDRATCRTAVTRAGAGQVIDGYLGNGFQDTGAGEVTTDGWQVTGTFERGVKTAGPHATAHLRLELPRATIGILITCQPEDWGTTRVYKLITRSDLGGDAALLGEFTRDEDRDLAESLALMEGCGAGLLPLDPDAAAGTAGHLNIAWRRLMARAIAGLPVTIGVMAYDETLAARIRDLIGPDPELTEKKMFGGLAFLIRGHMAISASGQGGALVRVDPARADDLLATTRATVAVMGTREMHGWLRVAMDDLTTDEDLSPWVERGIEHARSLPPKK
jgi:nitrite reductase/ring-hydroxylating ferredoxin subunit